MVITDLANRTDLTDRFLVAISVCVAAFDDLLFGVSRHFECMARRDLIEENLTRSVIGAFFEVYNNLGYGFLEHLYVMALERELLARGHTVAREVWARVVYKEEELGIQRVDMIVDGRVVVETKAGSKLSEYAGRQLFNYLRATNLEVGLLLHFGPKATFHREICPNKRSNRINPSDPPNPLNHRS
jgi:GxxExxY protein